MPTIGRWASEDPIGFSTLDTNLARYVGNNVLLSLDPSGLMAPDQGVQDLPRIDKPRSDLVHRCESFWERLGQRIRERPFREFLKRFSERFKDITTSEEFRRTVFEDLKKMNDATPEELAKKIQDIVKTRALEAANKAAREVARGTDSEPQVDLEGMFEACPHHGPEGPPRRPPEPPKNGPTVDSFWNVTVNVGGDFARQFQQGRRDLKFDDINWGIGFGIEFKYP